MTAEISRTLDRLTRVPHVRGAMLVGHDDGLIIADSTPESMNSKAMAALMASLTSRLRRLHIEMGDAAPTFVHLETESGAILATPVLEEMLLVVVATSDANIGLVRLEMLEVERTP